MNATRRAAAMAAVAVALAVAASAAPADAQPRRPAPSPVDRDDAEHHSAFWERALAPHRDTYDDHVSRAAQLLERRDPTREREALELLRIAVTLEPERPLAWWLLSDIQQTQGAWQQCADARRHIARVAPDFDPPGSSRPGWALDFGLALCMSRAGDFEDAVAHYKRVLQRGASRSHELHFHLGEAYMALGRLAEAIESLETAMQGWRSHSQTRFALAVALDRDEKDARSREQLAEALRLDPSLSRLTAPQVGYAPAADLYYFLGLAHRGRLEPEWSIVYFRRYLHESGGGPWRARVRRHIAEQQRDPFAAERIDLGGSERLDATRVAAAVRQAADELHACMAPVPGVLLRVRITSVAQRPGESGKRAVEPGVKATVAHAFDTSAEDAQAAVQCVEEAAARLALPRPRTPGAHATVQFPLVSR